MEGTLAILYCDIGTKTKLPNGPWQCWTRSGKRRYSASYQKLVAGCGCGILRGESMNICDARTHQRARRTICPPPSRTARFEQDIHLQRMVRLFWHIVSIFALLLCPANECGFLLSRRILGGSRQVPARDCYRPINIIASGQADQSGEFNSKYKTQSSAQGKALIGLGPRYPAAKKISWIDLLTKV